MCQTKRLLAWTNDDKTANRNICEQVQLEHYLLAFACSVSFHRERNSSILLPLSSVSFCLPRREK